ncbi:MAG: hypothetical protein HDR07_03590 [Lachnospiraceae bacterium]|nr:hypothetical protein [Lachnospiraceae bacterium]
MFLDEAIAMAAIKIRVLAKSIKFIYNSFMPKGAFLAYNRNATARGVIYEVEQKD